MLAHELLIIITDNSALHMVQSNEFQARQHAHDLLFERLISSEVAQKAMTILILKDVAKEKRNN